MAEDTYELRLEQVRPLYKISCVFVRRFLYFSNSCICQEEFHITREQEAYTIIPMAGDQVPHCSTPTPGHLTT